MSTELLVLHGPNFNLLGDREPEVYGSESLAELVERIRGYASEKGFGVRDFQSNSEGDLIDHLHEARNWAAGIIFNAGAYTHTSVALRDAIAAIDIPVVEVHISNVHGRESFRTTSLIAPVCAGTLSGFGTKGYFLAVDALID